MIPFIDIHTHTDTQHDGVISVVSYKQFETPSESARYFSVGLHPWLFEKMHEEKEQACYEWLVELAHHPNCIMYGEAGLDRNSKASLKTQKRVFEWQIEAAYSRPLIIHSVGTYNEMISLIKRHKNHTPWILHGYNSSTEMTKQLSDAGYYFSLGSEVLNENSKLKDSIHLIPLDRLFLETDESAITIQEIYSRVSLLLNIELIELKQLIYNNFHKIFHDSKLD